MTDEFESIDAYLNAANYISVAQLYLKDNFFLEDQLKFSDIKLHVKGHWGTSYGINFIMANLNFHVKKNQYQSYVIIGTGHSIEAWNAQLLMSGFYQEKYLLTDKVMSEKVISEFGTNKFFQTEISPYCPKTIYEGGELGYSLGTAYGISFSNNIDITYCIIGDGEAETGPLLASLNSIKYINYKSCSFITPIINLNGSKMSGYSVLSTFSDIDLLNYFNSMGYETRISLNAHEEMQILLNWSYALHNSNKERSKNIDFFNHRIPLIILKTKKGETGPEKYHGEMIVDTFRAHKAPIEVKSDEDLYLLNKWLSSYKPEKIFSGNNFSEIIKNCIPNKKFRINESYRKKEKKFELVDIIKISNEEDIYESPIEIALMYLEKVGTENKNVFKLFSPDESISNRLSNFSLNLNKLYGWESREENISPFGSLIEILSEQTCLSWMRGYILDGNKAFLIMYEGFSLLIASMLIQHIKFINQVLDFKCSDKRESLNIILTSLSWKNCFSHQNSDLIKILYGKKRIKIYTPIDGNTMQICCKLSLETSNKINLIIGTKQKEILSESLFLDRTDIEKGYHWYMEDKEASRTIIACGDINFTEIRKCLQNIQKINVIIILELNAFVLNVNKIREKIKQTKIIFSFIGGKDFGEFVAKALFPDNEVITKGYDEENILTGKFIPIEDCGISSNELEKLIFIENNKF